MDSQELTARHLQDLAQMADRRGRVVFSDFLGLAELNILYDLKQKFSWLCGKTFGGYKGAERKMAAFFSSDMGISQLEEYIPAPDGTDTDDSLAISFPIACIHIKATSARFAEKLTHRDVLGALMHLGIERDKTGDIAVLEGEVFLFCVESLADMICSELVRIRHTTVNCVVCPLAELNWEPSFERVRGSVASIRLDTVLSVAFGASRSSLISMIEGGSVYVNGRLITTNAYHLQEGDIVSARGHGRFRYIGSTGTSKKGRTWVELDKYV